MHKQFHRGQKLFDPAQIRVLATITRPNGTSIEVEGYWYQEYAIVNVNGQRSTKKVADPYWRISFSSIMEMPSNSAVLPVFVEHSIGGEGEEGAMWICAKNSLYCD